MDTYVVGIYNAFDGSNELKVVTASDPVEAITSAMEDDLTFDSVEEAKNFYAEADMHVTTPLSLSSVSV